MNRGERIHRKRRNLERWRNIVSGWFKGSTVQDEVRERLAKRASEHGKLCSCHFCSNRRKHEGDSIQERRASQSDGEVDGH